MSLNLFSSFDDPDNLHSVTFSPRIDSGKLIAELPSLFVAALQVEA